MDTLREQIKAAAEAQGPQTQKLAARSVEQSFEKSLGAMAQKLAAEQGVDAPGTPSRHR